MAKDFRIKTIKEFIGDTLVEATLFPLYFRIAAKLISAGFTEKDFHEAVERGDFSLIPSPLLNNVRTAVRDIERKQMPTLSQTNGKILLRLIEQL
jgi:hypothetical protein